jgi:hypothetical protein
VDPLIDPANTLPVCSVDTSNKRSKYFSAAPGRIEISLTSGEREREVESSVCCVTCLSSLAARPNVALVERVQTFMCSNGKSRAMALQRENRGS